MNTLGQDLRYALRMLRRARASRPSPSATLALGIGANTAIFSVVHAMLLRPLPYPRPEELVRITSDFVEDATDRRRSLRSRDVRLPRTHRSLHRDVGVVPHQRQRDRRRPPRARRSAPDGRQVLPRSSARRPRSAASSRRRTTTPGSPTRRSLRRVLAPAVRRGPERRRQAAAHRRRPLHDHRRAPPGFRHPGREHRNRRRSLGAVRLARTALPAARTAAPISSRARSRASLPASRWRPRRSASTRSALDLRKRVPGRLSRDRRLGAPRLTAAGRSRRAACRPACRASRRRRPSCS